MSPHTIIAVSDSDKHFALSIDEYIKRLSKTCKIINLKPSRNPDHHKAIQEETDLIIKTIKSYSDSYVIACSREGVQKDTLALATLMAQHHHCLWIIGGAYGYDEVRLKPYIHSRVAFGQITLQHSLTKLIVLEQIYRCQMIQQGRSYHY